MLNKEQYARVKQLASAPSTPEKIYTVKTGENAGMKRKVNAKPERVGLLPVSEKTIWTWVKQGKFPQPIRMSGNVTVWRMSEVQAWIEEQANIATMGAKFMTKTQIKAIALKASRQLNAVAKDIYNRD